MAKEKKIKEENKKAKVVEDQAQAAAGNAPEQPEYSEEQLEFARINMRKQFNERFSKWAEIEPENADDAYIEQVKKELEDAVETQKKAVYNIGSHEDGLALKTAEFLKTWNEHFNSWEKGSWRGLIRFNVVIEGIIEALKTDDTKDLEIDYQTLIFLYNSMMNPSGIGLETARKMAEFENYNEATDGPFEENIPVTYSGILSKVNEHVATLGAIDKKLNILRQKLQLAYMGLRMNLKISELEEFVEFNNVITNQGVADATKEEMPDRD